MAIFNSVAIALLGLALSHPSIAAPTDYPPTTTSPYGEASPIFTITETELTLPDTGRGKPLHVRIYAPTIPEDSPRLDSVPEAGLPIILFSHGFLGSNKAFADAAALWASHGYIVLLPTHADSLALPEVKEQMRERIRDRVRERLGRHPRTQDQAPNEETKVAEASAWLERALDQSQILDAMPTILEMSPSLEALSTRFGIDTNNTASAGHSFGAQTCQLLGGATLTNANAKPINARDPRIKAVLPISPQGPGVLGFTEDSWSTLAVPVLAITGTNDTGQQAQTPDDRVRGYTLAQGIDKFLLLIDAAYHSSFGGRTDSGNRRAERRLFQQLGLSPSENSTELDTAIGAHTASVALAFFDAYLRKDADAKAYLLSDGPSSVRESTARWSNSLDQSASVQP